VKSVKRNRGWKLTISFPKQPLVKMTKPQTFAHTDYHQKLGKRNIKNPDMAFHFYFFDKWLYGLLGLILLLIGYLFF